MANDIHKGLRRFDDTEHESVSTEDLDIGGDDYVANGEFVPRVTLSNIQDRITSTTSTSYVSDSNYSSQPVVWDVIVPSGGQGAIHHTSRLNSSTGSETVSARVYNSTDNEVALPETTESDDFTLTNGPENYTPTTTGDLIQLQVEIKTDPGTDSITMSDFTVAIGVQV